MRFADRRDAGRRLAGAVAEAGPSDPFVLALPRGGVPVGAEVARALRAPLAVLGVLKLGAPALPELALGAIAEGGVSIVDERALASLGLVQADLEQTRVREQGELDRRIARYRAGALLPDLSGRTTLIVDDGLATGWTAVAAARAATNLGASRVWVCAPVGSPRAAERLRGECDGSSRWPVRRAPGPSASPTRTSGR
jgi:putative phosphoribosyl transferase